MPATASNFDAARLKSFLSEQLDHTVVDIELLHHGLNRVLAISIVGGEQPFVLRQRRKLGAASYIIDIEDEYGVVERLADTPVPAPGPVMFCDDDSILGDEFYVMTHLDGAEIPLGSDLPARFQNPDARRRVAELLVDTLTEIHAVDFEPFEDVCSYVTPRDQVERSAERLDAARAATGRGRPVLRDVATWLRQNAPSESRTTLVHGDYRPGNVLFSGTDRPVLSGVLDWETALLGDPMTELGYLLLRWRDAGDSTPSLREIESRYPDLDAIADLEDANERGLAPFTAELGSPTRRELVARYEERTGFSFEHERFYRALAAFMLTTVWVDLHRHDVEAGAESDWAPYIRYMTMVADSIVRGEFEL